MEKKLEVLWLSDLVVPTGFSKVSHSIIKFMQDKVNVTGVGVNYYGDPHPYPFPIFPTQPHRNDVYGIKRLQALAQKHWDVIFILNDVWVIDSYLEAIKEHFKDDMPEIIVYFPVDAEDHNPYWYKHFDIVSKAVAYTEFGKRVALKACPEIADKLEIIPHGVDHKVFFKLDEDREKSKALAREKIFVGHKELEDSFIFLSANRNQPRKKLDITMEGFTLFSKGKPSNVRLYMHCGMIDNSMDIGALSNRFGIGDRLIVTSQTRGIQTVPEAQLNYIYNACDVGLNTSLGEGWGLTSIEHAITGAPQIVPSHSACAELYSDCGLLVNTPIAWRFDNIMTLGKVVTAEGVAQAMETLYTNKDLYNKLAKKGLEKFSSETYDWKNISERWLELFNKALE
jgi:D-inositol-3-phosphate glycosyltransferase